MALLRVEGWFLEKPGRVIDWTLTCASTLVQPCDRLVGRGGLELGDSLGALGDSVFGQLAGEQSQLSRPRRERKESRGGASGKDRSWGSPELEDRTMPRTCLFAIE